MVRTRTFIFTFDVSNAFLRQSPVAAQYIEACKRQIGARVSVQGPRGGLYRLVTPPDKWRESDEYGDAWIRDVRTFATRREGRYVRPERITPDLRLGGPIHFATLTTPVVRGMAVLPSGQTVETASPYIDFPVLVE